MISLKLLSNWIERCMDSLHFAVVEGGRETTEMLAESAAVQEQHPIDTHCPRIDEPLRPDHNDRADIDWTMSVLLNQRSRAKG
jgi:hypothetical protein